MRKKLLNMTIGVWLAIAKDGELQLFTEEPVRGKHSWIGNPYINSVVFKTVQQMIANSSMSWHSDPEYIELMFRDPNQPRPEDEEE